MQLTGLHAKFDFEASGAIGKYWIKSGVSAPAGFLLIGGDAIVIERHPDSDPTVLGQQRVLLALPELAVDMKRARWLSRRGGFSAEAAHLCHLWRCVELKAFGKVILEFGFPKGEPLCDVLQRGDRRPRPLATATARRCRRRPPRAACPIQAGRRLQVSINTAAYKLIRELFEYSIRS